MIDPNHISLPSGPVKGTSTMGQLKRHQGAVRCLLTTVVHDDTCNRVVSGNRVLCGPCRARLLFAGVTELVFDAGRQRVDVGRNEATLIDRLKRIA